MGGVPEEPGYVPLRVRSNYSLLSGASHVGKMLDRAAEIGLGAIALTDENNLYGAPLFFESARERGIRPILGALVDDPPIVGGPRAGGGGGGGGGGRQAVLLVRDASGYASLCRVISRRMLEDDFSLERALSEKSAGLFILTPDLELAEALVGSAEPGSLWCELIRPGASVNAERRLLETARRLGLGVVASCDVYFADGAEPGDFDLHELLTAMAENTVLAEVARRLSGRRECFLRPGAQMARLFGDMPEALAATGRIAAGCDFDLLGRETVFPRLGDGGTGSAERLMTETLAGARRRYGEVGAAALSRIRRELDLITRLGFVDYFLVVADIVRHARSLGTPVAGRGSGASSIVAYSLGVTNVDPLKYNLPFERFLNAGRRDFPDLDIDFCWRLRDDVIDYVYETYGDDRVAMIATYATCQPRLAFREVAKALGLSSEDITTIADRLRAGMPRSRWRTLPAEPGTIDRIYDLAGRIEGFPHHLSVHCGGVVITPGAISRHAPLQRAEKGVVITQYDKDGVEAVGLVKLDLLGNRALSTTAEAMRLLGDRGVDPEAVPDGEPRTVTGLAAGDTVGVNQLESPAMRHLLRQLRPRNIRQVMQVLALIRPGAASLGMKEEYVRRARGVSPVRPLDERLDGILGETHGIMLYEDDALLVAAAIAGLSVVDADRFRRAVTKCRNDDERLRLSRDFLCRCRENGVDSELARDLWVQMSKFNSYSFCRAHAASYARLAWANAWLKAHHPPEFWTAALNNNQSMYPKWVYVEEAKRAGVPLLLPCVNRSGVEFVLESGGGGAIRTGLGRVRGLSERAVDSIISGRTTGAGGGPFEGVLDLVARTCVKIAEAENLVRCGALDCTGRSRPEMMLDLHTDFESAKALRGRMELVRFTPESTAVGARLDDYSAAQKRSDEWELVELFVGPHPMAPFRRALSGGGAVFGSEAAACRPGKPVTVAGLAAAGRSTRTATGERMCFITLSDESGLTEVTLFPAVYKRHRLEMVEAGLGPFVIEGVIESQYDALSVTAGRVETLRGFLARMRKCGRRGRWAGSSSGRRATASRTG